MVVGPDEEVREQLVADWWEQAGRHLRHDTGELSGVMIAARRSDVDDLNDRARRHLLGTGVLHGPAIGSVEGKQFRSGDHVMMLRNDAGLGVLNGTRGTVTAIDRDCRSVTVDLGDGRCVELPPGYVDAGHLTHGYAITAHKAQGLTTDQAWVLGSAGLYREWGYVALSRARESTTLYLSDREIDELHDHGIQVLPDPIARAGTSLERTRGQQLAHEHAGTPDLEVGIG